MLQFEIPLVGTMTRTHCKRQTELPGIAGALKSPESCTKASCLFALEHRQKLVGTVYSE